MFVNWHNESSIYGGVYSQYELNCVPAADAINIFEK